MPNETPKTEEKQVSERFNLGDVSVLTQLFEVVLYDVVRRSQMVARSELKREEAVAMDKQSAAFLSAVLAGKNEQFIAKPYWTGDPLAGYLKLYMKERFESVGIKPDELKDTRDILQAASFEFVCQAAPRPVPAPGRTARWKARRPTRRPGPAPRSGGNSGRAAAFAGQ